jgi:hypothetical protein
MRFNEALKQIDKNKNIILKHMPGNRSPKEHIPYKDRDVGWIKKYAELQKATETDISKYLDMAQIMKFNPYHDQRGRFSSAGGAHSVHTRAGERFGTALAMQHHGHKISQEDLKSQIAYMREHKGSLAGWESPSHSAKKARETAQAKAMAEVKDSIGSTVKKTHSMKRRHLEEMAAKAGIATPEKMSKAALAYHLHEKTGKGILPDGTKEPKSMAELDKMSPVDKYALLRKHAGGELSPEKLSPAAADRFLQEKYSLADKAKMVPKLDIKATMAAIKPEASWLERQKGEAERKIERHAREHGMSADQYLEASAAKIKELVKDAEFKIRIDGNILGDKIVNPTSDGYFKNQHATKKSGGALSPGPEGARAYAEQTMFSIDRNASWKEHPVYGYLTGTGDSGSHVWYGTEHGGPQVCVTLKPSVKEQATITFGDSLGRGYVPFKATSIDKSSYLALSPHSDRDPLKAKKIGDLRSGAYVEAQYHGGITRDDIAHVSLLGSRTRNSELTKMLDQAGIPWSEGTRDD